MPYQRSEWTDDFEKYRDTVSQYLQKHYCITWHDACGDEAPIRNAIQDGERRPGLPIGGRRNTIRSCTRKARTDS